MLKKKPLHDASVVQVRFDHLSGRMIASASLDSKIKLTTAYLEDLDSDGSGPFANITTYGETLMAVKMGSWTNGLAFSPNCTEIGCVNQGGELIFYPVSDAVSAVDKKDERYKPNGAKTEHKGNPHLHLTYISDDKVVATGFDKVPYLYTKQGSEWKETKVLD